MSPVPLPNLMLLAAILAGTGAFLLALDALALLQIAFTWLMLRLSPRMAHDLQLQAALDRYRPTLGARFDKRRP